MKLLSILLLSFAASTSAVSFFEELIKQQSDGKNSMLKKKIRRRGLSKVSQNNHRNLEVSEECLNADAVLEEAVRGNEENLAIVQTLFDHVNCPIDCGEDATTRLCTVGLGIAPAYMADLQALTELCESFDARLFYVDYDPKEEAVAAGMDDILVQNVPECWPNVCSDDEVREIYAGTSDAPFDFTPSDMTFYSKPPKGCSWVWSGGKMSEKRSKASKAAKAAKAMEDMN